MSDFFAAVGSFFSFLGLQAILLIIATFSILYLLGIVSPLKRRANFTLAVLFGLALFFISGFEQEALGKYLLVMLFPLILSYGVILIFKGLKMVHMGYMGKKEPSKEALMGELLKSTAEFQKESDLKELRKNLKNIVEKL